MYISLRTSLIDLHGFQLLVLLPLLIEIIFFVVTDRIDLRLNPNSKKLAIVAKGFLKLSNLLIIKSITSQRFGSRDFWRITNKVFNTRKSAILALFNGPEVLFCASDKAKLFAEIFPLNCNLNDSGISLPAFLSTTNLRCLIFL